MASILKPLNAFGRIGSLTGPQWIELTAKHAPQVIAGLAVIGIAWQAAQLTWLFISPSPAPAPTTNAAQNEPPSTTKAIDAQGIANAHLFGVANTSTNADPNNLPQTQMSLVLAGTMALDDPEMGFAIVGENAATAKFYRAGSVISGGPRLHAVYADRVIIDRNGVLETLVLPRGAPSTAPVPVARNVVTNPVADNLRRIANNPTALGELLRAQPVFSNGVQKGYRVYPGRDRQQFVRLGLQPGDLVTAINGATLDDPTRGTEILNTLTASTTAQVVVERNGTSQQLTLDMAQLSVPETATTDANSSSSSVSNGPPQGGFNGPAGNRGPRGTRNGNTPNGQPASTSAQ